MKRHIPNFITCLNLLSGCIAITFAFKGELLIASYLVLLSAVFDFLDGMLARMLKAYSPLGKQLDSLADMISFGLLPGVVVYNLLQQGALNGCPREIFTYIAFIIPVFSALRLAKFNIDERQSDYFIGMPTPANALFFASIPLIIEFKQTGYLFFGNPYVLILLSIVMSFMLVAELPLLSLKFKNTSWADNKIRYILIIISAILIFIFKFAAVPFIILLYILLSLKYQKNKV